MFMMVLCICLLYMCVLICMCDDKCLWDGLCVCTIYVYRLCKLVCECSMWGGLCM